MSPPRKVSSQQDLVELVFNHPQVTADTTTKEFKTGARPFRIDSVEYLNPTGLAGHATDFYTIKLQTGAGPTVLASWSTQTGVQGTIAADTFVSPVLNATASNLVLAAGSTLSMFLDRAAPAATLPAGKMIVRGRYL